MGNVHLQSYMFSSDSVGNFKFQIYGIIARWQISVQRRFGNRDHLLLAKKGMTIRFLRIFPRHRNRILCTSAWTKTQAQAIATA